MPSSRRIILALCCAAGIMFQPESNGTRAQEPPSTDKTRDQFYPLLAKNFPGETWTVFSGRKDSPIGETWKLAEDAETNSLLLICTGVPHGYLKTRKVFRNFDLKLEWKYPTDPNGNSGVLLFTSGEDRVWPASLQVQFFQPELGSTFPIAGAKSTNEFHLDAKLSRPVNQWNQCELRCRDGSVTVIINGHTVGEVQGCVPVSGAIALQSEGSEIHFRAISIREIPVAQNSDVPEVSGKEASMLPAGAISSPPNP